MNSSFTAKISVSCQYKVSTATNIMGRVIGKTHIRHGPSGPIPLETEAQSTFLVKSTTPYILAIKRITKMLAKFESSPSQHRRFHGGEYRKVQYIRVKSMGRAIPSALSIGIHFEHNHQYHTEYITGTTLVLDEFTSPNDSDDDSSEMKKRLVSTLEIRIWLKKEAKVTWFVWLTR